MRRLLWCLWAIAGGAAAELGVELRPGLGQPARADFEAVVLPDGSGLPVGSGTVAEGQALYARHCAACHGADGRQAGNALVGGQGSLTSATPHRTVGSYWPYATTLYDYVNRAMPYGNEKSLTADEVYAVVGYVLFLNDIVPAEAELTQVTLPDVLMPNAGGFRSAPSFQPLRSGDEPHR